MDEKRKITPRELVLPIVLTLILGVLLAASLFFESTEQTEDPPARSMELIGESGELYFNTSCRFIDYSGLSDEDLSKVSELIRAELDYYHKIFDIYNTYEGITNIKSLNDAAGTGAVSISSPLFDFLEYAKEMHDLTGGEVNIAMGAVLSIWHEYREAGVSLPEPSLLEAAAEHTDINSLILDGENMTAELTDEAMSLDVGAIAKGYAAERIAERLEAEGYTSMILDLGGNLRAIGSKPSGEGWKTGVKNPDPAADSYLYEFELKDGSAVTSGDYERYYIVDGEKYHHIIDKDTLMPAEHFRSVTVITADSALADALSTALFNMTYEEGASLVESLGDVRAVWLTTDGNVIISK